MKWNLNPPAKCIGSLLSAEDEIENEGKCFDVASQRLTLSETKSKSKRFPKFENKNLRMFKIAKD